MYDSLKNGGDLTVSTLMSDIEAKNGEAVRTSPEAIRACVASLAAEAFDSGHARAAQVLAHAAALLTQPHLWSKSG